MISNPPAAVTARIPPAQRVSTVRSVMSAPALWASSTRQRPQGGLEALEWRRRHSGAYLADARTRMQDPGGHARRQAELDHAAYVHTDRRSPVVPGGQLETTALTDAYRRHGLG